MTKRNCRPAALHVRKLKDESGTNLPSLSKARLKELIEEAIVDAYGEEEQAGGFFTMIEEHLALPFPVKVLGVDADVEKVDMTLDGQMVATVEAKRARRSRLTQRC
jgi:Calcium binding